MFPVLAGNSASTGYNLTRSLRTRASASGYLSRTPASAGNRKTWTWSSWVKRGALSAAGNIFTSPYSATDNFLFRFLGDDAFQIANTIASTQTLNLITTQVFRDPSAWYHIVLSIDTTQATSSNRASLYVNGSKVSAFSTSTYPSLNADLNINQTNAHNISNLSGSAQYFDGYLAEVNFIDGQALTPSSFGSTNALTGVWQPARYTGTYGTNGFYLPFTDNSLLTSSSNVGLGKDFSGNGNYWATNNISLYGGTVTSFTATGTTSWTAPTGVTSVEYLVVAGGGGGGSGGGGGGAGGFLTGSLLVTPGNSYTVTVGAGGTGGTGGGNGTAGSNSVFSTITATGGGYGGGDASGIGGNGGSGGGAGAFYSGNVSGGTGTSGQGFAGGSQTGSQESSGGGGGANAVGANASGTTSGAGGAGKSSSISGTSVTYAGGGGGGARPSGAGAAGGSGGGGAGTNSGAGGIGAANRGAGGGGGAGYPSFGNGGAGGSGIVIISYGASVTYDSMTDVPTLTSATAANYCVLNPLAIGAATTASGNLNLTNSATVLWDAVLGTMGFSSGKYYWEMTTDAIYPANVFCGIAGVDIPYSTTNLQDASSTLNTYGSLLFCDDGKYQLDGSARVAYSTALTASQVLGVAVDRDAKTCVFYKNGVSLGSISFSSSAMAAKTIVPIAISVYSGSVYVFNFGQRPFTYTPPTGFVALNTYNLPTSTILQGNKVMDATLYTGTNATLSVTNAGAFKPDLVWIKGRSQSSNNVLQDSVRGANRYLSSNLTAAEGTDGSLTSFNSNGFSLTTDPGVSYNANGTTYVGWQWQAGQGSTSSNTSGTITSTVSVNASAGFSVVTYTGTGANGATVGHGLGVAPSLMIIKARSLVSNWGVYHASVGNTAALVLDTSSAISTSVLWWNNTSPTSSVFSLGTIAALNTNGTTHVAYCWTPIAGYSAFGSYTGNGSADGPFVYLGFRPKFVLIKMTSSTGDWYLYDSSRDPYNATQKGLVPNSSASETTYTGWGDLLSNGFKIRRTDAAWNSSGGTYIYACFSENPFRNSLAR